MPIIADPLPPPMNVRLSSVNDGQISFIWDPDPLVSSCTALYYIVNATDSCGVCPSNTTSTSITCTDITVSSNGQVCRFVVQTTVCDAITGMMSRSVEAVLKGNIHTHNYT